MEKNKGLLYVTVYYTTSWFMGIPMLGYMFPIQKGSNIIISICKQPSTNMFVFPHCSLDWILMSRVFCLLRMDNTVDGEERSNLIVYSVQYIPIFDHWISEPSTVSGQITIIPKPEWSGHFEGIPLQTHHLGWLAVWSLNFAQAVWTCSFTNNKPACYNLVTFHEILVAYWLWILRT